MKKFIALLLSLVIFSVSLAIPVYADKAQDSFTEYMRECFEDFRNVVDISDYNYKYGWKSEDSLKALENAFYSLPEMFYVNNEKISRSYDKYSDTTIQFFFTYTMTKSEAEKAQKKIDQAVENILAGITDDMSDLDKALYVHDYLILNCSYNTSASKTVHSIYDCLIKKSTVCQGYSLAYEYILRDKLGIECTTVVSDSQNHMWNYVKIGKKWYHVDVTADDPLTFYGSRSFDKYGVVEHNNFLMSDERCKASDSLHRDWHIIGDQPAASDKSYDNAFWIGIRSKINIVNGYYYYTTNGAKTGEKPVVNVCRYDPKKKKSKVLAKLDSKWYISRNSSGATFEYGKRLYDTVWSSLEYRNGKLYFNSSKNVYSYDISTKKYKKIYTLNKGEEQQIYGMVMTDGKLRLAYKKDHTYDEKYLKLVLK